MKQFYCYLFVIIQVLHKNLSFGFNENLNGKYFLLNYGNPDILQQQTGYNITLECGIKGHDAEYVQGTVITWYFKSCGQNLNQKPCQNSFHDDWIRLPCDNKICNATLFLRNITEENSGLYKCTIYPYKTKKGLQIHIKSNELTTLGIQLVQTFQLYVRNTTILPPEFIDDNPKNMTAKIDDQIVLQCWVHSKEPPTIRWFKRIEIRDNNKSNQIQKNQYSSNVENYSHTIPYLENTYEFLKTGGVKVLTEDLYLSKLILNSITKTMEGFYACVPINSRGHKIREAYIKVDESFMNISQNINYMKYFSLFLMPVGLAILPLSFWLCFCCRKKCKKRSYIREDEEISLRINI